MDRRKSFDKAPLSRKDVSAALAPDWLRVSTAIGRGTFADAIGVECTETVKNAITGPGLPELHTALNSLLADETALFNVFQRLGGVFVRIGPGACNDNECISGMLRAATDYFERMKDGIRDHNDTVALAELFRPLIPAMLCVVQEASQIKGAV